MNTVRRIWSSYCPTFYRGNLLLYLWPPFPPASQLYGSDAVSTLETAHPDADDQRSLPKSYQHVDVPTRENNTGLPSLHISQYGERLDTGVSELNPLSQDSLTLYHHVEN